MTGPEFILLFSTVTFHICIYFPVEMVFRLQRLFFWRCSASLSLSLSSPAPCTNTHLPCLFIPSPHTAAHQSSFLNQGFHTAQSLSKVHKTLDLASLKRAKKLVQNFSIMPKLREFCKCAVNGYLGICLMKFTG